jgi:hypothetical protein
MPDERGAREDHPLDGSLFLPREQILMKQHYPAFGNGMLTAAAILFLGINTANAQHRTPVVYAPGVTTHPDVVNTMRGSAPPNDNCSSVTTQVLPLGGSITFTGDNTGATATNDFEPGSPLEGVGPCVWHKFSIAGCANITVSYCATSPAFAGVAAFLSPSCPSGSDYVLYFDYNYSECGNGNGTVHYTAVPAGTYYLPVMMNSAIGAVGPYEIEVSAEACATPPANDDCPTAISLTPGTFCNYSYYTTNGATESMPAADCGTDVGFANDDVWFSFTATSTDMTIGVQGVDDGDGDPDSGFNAVVELFEGPCVDPTSLDCSDDSLANQLEVLNATGLTVGQTYHVRVYDWNPGYPAMDSFGICIVEGGNINLGIHDLDRTADWGLYPNPGNGIFHLHYNGLPGKGTVEVLDVTGRVVLKDVLELATGGEYTLALGKVNAGNYTVQLSVNGVRSVRQLLVR